MNIVQSVQWNWHCVQIMGCICYLLTKMSKKKKVSSKPVGVYPIFLDFNVHHKIYSVLYEAWEKKNSPNTVIVIIVESVWVCGFVSVT